MSHPVQKSPWLLKDCGKIKLEGVVIIADQKTLIGFPVASVKGRGQMLAVLLILPAEETSVTRAVESDKYKEMSYRKIAGEVTVLKLNSLAAAACQAAERFPLLNTNVSFTRCIWGKKNSAEAGGKHYRC